MRIGLIGLGAMGIGMARNLLAAGHELAVYNRSRNKSEALVEAGATVADTPAEAARGEAVITMLADDAATEAVVFGTNGVLGALPAGSIHAAMSTISVALADRLTAVHAERGQVYVAAPVFGRPEAAAAAKLYVMAAGPAGAVERCRPMFEAIGQMIYPVGERPSAANVVKLAGNFMIAATIETLGEAIALVRKSGVDPRQFVDILTGTLFAAPIYRTYGGIILDEKYLPAGFKAPLGLKDARLVLAAAEAAQVPLPIASLIRDHYLALLAGGGEELDWSALAQLAARRAGL